MTIRNTIDHLKHVAQQEGITCEEQALAVIAEKADGGMRDALSIFDQAASFCQGNITYDKVIEDLNVLDSENYFQIIDLSINNKVSDIMVLLNTIINKGFDGGLLIQGLAKHVRNVLMAKDPQTLPLLEVSDQQRQRYAEQAKKADTRFLYQALRLMNQCDINYRQSSNKRLLVELTLIEVAQITQPDDGASAGRRPKRLKSLFKKLIQQSQPKTVAPQVATAKTVASTPASPKIQASQETKTAQEPKTSQEPQTTQEPQATQKPQASPAKPATQGLKLGGIGFSWNRLRNQSKPSKINSIPNSISHAIEQQTDAAFTQEDLELQWMSMCVRMPQEYQGIATRMKNMNPVIVESPQIEVIVDNDLIKDEMEDFKGRIVSTLKQSLHNNNITLSIRVAKQKERVKIMTRREQFDMMREKNPAVEALRQAFDLELA
jgi:DNA polymerase-3 subunit gamma/tau